MRWHCLLRKNEGSLAGVRYMQREGVCFFNGFHMAIMGGEPPGTLK